MLHKYSADFGSAPYRRFFRAPALRPAAFFLRLPVLLLNDFMIATITASAAAFAATDAADLAARAICACALSIKPLAFFFRFFAIIALPLDKVGYWMLFALRARRVLPAARLRGASLGEGPGRNLSAIAWRLSGMASAICCGILAICCGTFFARFASARAVPFEAATASPAKFPNSKAMAAASFGLASTKSNSR